MILYVLFLSNDALRWLIVRLYFIYLRICPGYVKRPTIQRTRGSHTPDLALIELARWVEFKRGSVSPICLPYAGINDQLTKSEPEMKAYVAGWGNDAYSKRTCSTNEFGPAPHTMCSFPFRFANSVFPSKCTTISSPSTYNSVCRQFSNWAWSKRIDLWGSKLDKSYFIKYWNRTKGRRGGIERITCYSPSTCRYGWCGTCYDYGGGLLKSDEEGYCSGKSSKHPLVYNIKFIYPLNLIYNLFSTILIYN